jgi:hypothetical protein
VEISYVAQDDPLRGEIAWFLLSSLKFFPTFSFRRALSARKGPGTPILGSLTRAIRTAKTSVSPLKQAQRKEATMDADVGHGAEIESGNLPLGIGAGLVATLLGAALWMGITVATGLHIGYVAIAIGAMVGYAVRVVGKGSTPVFGVSGAVLTLVGCLLGQMAAETELAAKQASVGFFDVLSSVGIGTIFSATIQSAGPITYFIYAIGVYEGYKLSINR